MRGGSLAEPEAPGIELSVVIPCLDEADTLDRCLEKAQRALAAAGIAGEIIVADNGSTDASREIARRRGVRVVAVPERGYGSALMAGIAASRGKYVLMGDADDSYDFGEIPKFVEKLRAGFELVQGCRLRSGGGRVMPGAMPWLAPRLGQSDVLAAGALVVPGSDPRRLLRTARVHARAVRPARPALHRAWSSRPR